MVTRLVSVRKKTVPFQLGTSPLAHRACAVSCILCYSSVHAYHTDIRRSERNHYALRLCFDSVCIQRVVCILVLVVTFKLIAQLRRSAVSACHTEGSKPANCCLDSGIYLV